jgi:transposase
VDLQKITVATQYDHSAIKPVAVFSVPELLQWIRQRLAEGHIVWSVYEACGFGYTLHHQLAATGAHNLLIGPVRLDPQRHRKNDGLDARALCTRLSRYLDGQKTELPVIRVPTVAEQQRRETGRQRDFWKGQLQSIDNHARALRLEHEHQSLPRNWWGPRNWKKVAPTITEFVRGFLEAFREQILLCKKQLDALTAELEARVAQDRLPSGLGHLTMALFEAELCNPFRFRNRKEIGSYVGCCPSEHSSGQTQHFGHIDRHGNKHLRVLMVEAVWRLIRFQPQWHALKKVTTRLQAGTALRKKTVIALARQLAIDLWRIRTQRATWAGLGLLPK